MDQFGEKDENENTATEKRNVRTLAEICSISKLVHSLRFIACYHVYCILMRLNKFSDEILFHDVRSSSWWMWLLMVFSYDFTFCCVSHSGPTPYFASIFIVINSVWFDSFGKKTPNQITFLFAQYFHCLFIEFSKQKKPFNIRRKNLYWS